MIVEVTVNRKKPILTENNMTTKFVLHLRLHFVLADVGRLSGNTVVFARSNLRLACGYMLVPNQKTMSL